MDILVYSFIIFSMSLHLNTLGIYVTEEQRCTFLDEKSRNGKLEPRNFSTRNGQFPGNFSILTQFGPNQPKNRPKLTKFCSIQQGTLNCTKQHLIYQIQAVLTLLVFQLPKNFWKQYLEGFFSISRFFLDEKLVIFPVSRREIETPRNVQLQVELIRTHDIRNEIGMLLANDNY